MFNRLYRSVQTDGDSFLFEYRFYRIGNVAVFAGNELVSPFQHDHFRTETGKHGGKFQSDITAAYNRQSAG